MLIFLSGVLTGIFIDQTYKVPQVSQLINKIKDELKKHEKKP
jgi:hypothetical protein